MQTKAEKDEHLDMIKNGYLDIIVGTHSLLGSRVAYNNLGLLVVDEEQVCLSLFALSLVNNLKVDLQNPCFIYFIYRGLE